LAETPHFDYNTPQVIALDADPTTTVILVNQAFYTALSLADLDLMQRLWLPSDDAVCEHPGWPALHGWREILASWRQIFENQGVLHVWPSEVQVRVYGQTAEVNCLENIDMRRVDAAGVLQTRAINIYRQAAGEWKMLAHHALPLPAGRLRPLAPFTPN
jgi:ketosteroid isomerase-like protein